MSIEELTRPQPLASVVDRNVRLALVIANLSQRQLAHHLALAPTAITRRGRENEWSVGELEAIAELLGTAPCLYFAKDPDTLTTLFAAKRLALVQRYQDNPNPNRETLRQWLAESYSDAYAQLILPIGQTQP